MAKRAEYLGPERRRPLVLDAAQAIFAEGGFTDASMAAIAARAGVSKAVLYDCFPDGKQEIYYALLERGEAVFMEHMLEVLEQTRRLPLEDGLRLGLTAFLEYAQINPLGFRIIFGEPGTSDPEIARRVEKTREVIIENMGLRTRQILADAGIPVTSLSQIYDRAIVAVSEEMARWMLREPSLNSHTIVVALVAWFMKGFEHIVPEDAWRRSAG
jgi:AcrR family transcriptional regulator